MKYFLFLLLIACTSCSLFDGLKKNSFAYDDGKTLPLVVPKGFRKVELQTDSAGNKTRMFTYGDGGTLYFYYGDTIKNRNPIDTMMHIAKFYPQDVLFYKGQDSSNGLFWRESRYKNFRFGYRNISFEREALFDSSLNNTGWQVVNAPIP
jgi:hypothetical protein